MLSRELKDRLIRTHLTVLLQHLRDTNGYTHVVTVDEEGLKRRCCITNGGLHDVVGDIMAVEVMWVNLYKDDTHCGQIMLLPYEGRTWDGVPNYTDQPELDAALKGFLGD